MSAAAAGAQGRCRVMRQAGAQAAAAGLGAQRVSAAARLGAVSAAHQGLVGGV